MTTSNIQRERGEEIGEPFALADGSLGGVEVRVIALKALSREEVLVLLRRTREQILQNPIPRV